MAGFAWGQIALNLAFVVSNPGHIVGVQVGIDDVQQATELVGDEVVVLLFLPGLTGGPFVGSNGVVIFSALLETELCTGDDGLVAVAQAFLDLTDSSGVDMFVRSRGTANIEHNGNRLNGVRERLPRLTQFGSKRRAVAV